MLNKQNDAPQRADANTRAMPHDNLPSYVKDRRVKEPETEDLLGMVKPAAAKITKIIMSKMATNKRYQNRAEVTALLFERWAIRRTLFAEAWVSPKSLVKSGVSIEERQVMRHYSFLRELGILAETAEQHNGGTVVDEIEEKTRGRAAPRIIRIEVLVEYLKGFGLTKTQLNNLMDATRTIKDAHHEANLV